MEEKRLSDREIDELIGIIRRQMPSNIADNLVQSIASGITTQNYILICHYLRYKLSFYNALGLIDLHFQSIFQDFVAFMQITGYGEAEVNYFSFTYSAYERLCDHHGKQYVKFKNDIQDISDFI